MLLTRAKKKRHATAWRALSAWRARLERVHEDRQRPQAPPGWQPPHRRRGRQPDGCHQPFHHPRLSKQLRLARLSMAQSTPGRRLRRSGRAAVRQIWARRTTVRGGVMRSAQLHVQTVVARDVRAVLQTRWLNVDFLQTRGTWWTRGSSQKSFVYRCDPFKSFSWCFVCVAQYVSGLALSGEGSTHPSWTASITWSSRLPLSPKATDPNSAQHQSLRLGVVVAVRGPDGIEWGGDGSFPAAQTENTR